MSVLLTGATGFVGRRVLQRAREAGIAVRAACRRRRPGLPEADEWAPVGEIDGETDWQAALAGVSAVIHLASRVHVMHASDDDLAQFRRTNVEGTRRLAEACLAAGVRRLVFVSSVKVNGESTSGRGPFCEADPPAPADPYGISKWEAEQALRAAAGRGLEVVVLRPPLVYGPGAKANLLRLMKLVASGVPLPLRGVSNARSMVGVDNLADAILAALRHPRATSRTYLVSDGDDLSTPGLVEHIARAMGRPARLWRCPPALLRAAGTLLGKAAEIQRLIGSLQVDSRPIRTELGWRPPLSVQAGIDEMVRAYARS